MKIRGTGEHNFSLEQNHFNTSDIQLSHSSGGGCCVLLVQQWQLQPQLQSLGNQSTCPFIAPAEELNLDLSRSDSASCHCVFWFKEETHLCSSNDRFVQFLCVHVSSYNSITALVTTNLSTARSRFQNKSHRLIKSYFNRFGLTLLSANRESKI